MYCPSVVLAFCMFQTRTKPEPHQNSTKQPPTTGPSSPPFYVFLFLGFCVFCVSVCSLILPLLYFCSCFLLGLCFSSFISSACCYYQSITYVL